MLKIHGPLSYVAAGLVIAIFIYSLFLNFRGHIESYFPHPPVFTATILVPDFKVGTDPIIQYSRTITATFQGVYYVEVKSAVDGGTACRGQGSAVYTVSDVTDPAVKFDWFANTDCSDKLVAGQYFIETNYVIHQPSSSDFYNVNSNIFHVIN